MMMLMMLMMMMMTRGGARRVEPRARLALDPRGKELAPPVHEESHRVLVVGKRLRGIVRGGVECVLGARQRRGAGASRAEGRPAPPPPPRPARRRCEPPPTPRTAPGRPSPPCSKARTPSSVEARRDDAARTRGTNPRYFDSACVSSRRRVRGPPPGAAPPPPTAPRPPRTRRRRARGRRVTRRRTGSSRTRAGPGRAAEPPRGNDDGRAVSRRPFLETPSPRRRRRRPGGLPLRRPPPPPPPRPRNNSRPDRGVVRVVPAVLADVNPARSSEPAARTRVHRVRVVPRRVGGGKIFRGGAQERARGA